MRKKVKSLRAVMLCILLVLQLFGWDNMNALAETINVTESYALVKDTADDIYMDTDAILTINEGYKLSGNIITGSGLSGQKICNYGSILGNINVPGVYIENYLKGNIVTVNCDSGGVIKNEGGSIKNLNISGGKVENRGFIELVTFTSDGEYYMEFGGATSISTGDIKNATINLKGGSIDTIESNSQISLTGDDVKIKSLTCGNIIGGTGKASVSESLYMKYNNSATSATISVNENTNLHFATGAGIKVQYNGNTYTLEYDAETSGTLAQLKGNTVSVTKGAYINEIAPIPSNKKYLCGSTSATAIYTAAEGYYFPANYKNNITHDGSGKFDVVSCTSDTVEFTYTPVSGEVEKEITITLPDATRKASQGAPTSVAGGTNVITGTTTAMEYAAENSDEWTECSEDSTEVAAGVWRVRFKETDTQLAGTPVSVRVKTEGTGSISVADIAYGGKLEPVVESDTYQTHLVEYKLKDADDSDYKSVAPTAVGKYTARVTFEENDTYISIDKTDDFEITKATKGAPARVVGGVDKITGTTAEMEYATDENAAADKWKNCSVGNTTVFAGTWYVRYKETATHFAGEPVSVRVRKMGTGSISVADITYGGTLNPVVESDTYQIHKIEYKLKDADDSTYKDEKPTLVGKYTARVTFEETDTYASTYKTDDFEIIKLSQGKPEGVEPEGVDVIIGTTNEMEYAKSKTAVADEWVACSAGKTTVSAGTWYVRYKETDTHFAGVPVAARVKTNGSGTLQVSDVYYGGSVKPVVTSNTNQSYTFQYRKKGTTEYTSDVPVEIGEYTARVTFEENDTYLSSVAYDDFEISYLPLPEEAYTISGAIGDNGYYVSGIKIAAALGYLVSDSQDGNYVPFLKYSKVPEATRLYFMKQNTGEKTAGISLPEINIDNELPMIAAIDNKVYYGDSIEIPVSDINLKEITVNGAECKFENGYTKLLLEANAGVSYYEIVVTDIAGNRNKIVVTVAAEWTETGVVPSGGIVRLVTNNAYKLGEGTWQVERDSTIYFGNQTFYIGKEGEYTFSNE